MEKELLEKKEDKSLFEIRKMFEHRMLSANLNNELEFVFTSIAYCLKYNKITKDESEAIINSVNYLSQGIKDIVAKCEINNSQAHDIS